MKHAILLGWLSCALVVGPCLRAEVAESPSDVARMQAEVDREAAVVKSLATQLDKLRSLRAEGVAKALAEQKIHDPTADAIEPKYEAILTEEERLLKSGVSEDDPRIKAARATKAVYVRQLDEQAESIRQSLAIQLDIQTKALEMSKQRLAELRGK